jgi:hypothetical protein
MTNNTAFFLIDSQRIRYRYSASKSYHICYESSHLHQTYNLLVLKEDIKVNNGECNIIIESE